MKAIILTYAPIEKFEHKLLKNTKIFKLALNQHAKDLNPDARIITDYVLKNIYKTHKEKIISVRDKLNYYSSRIEYPNIEFKGSTIIAAIDYLLLKHFDEILIVGNNKVNSIQFRNEVNHEIDKFTSDIKIYQYSDGNFNLKIMPIKEYVK